MRDTSGKRLAERPKPGAKDDASLAKAAHATWKELKKSVREAAAVQTRRLEQAMYNGRMWEAADFEAHVAGHPLVVHLARGLVWMLVSPDGASMDTFRISEDGTPASKTDRPVLLEAGLRVRLPHPIHLGDTRAAWGTLFADYAIVQPFAQLTRDVYTLRDNPLARVKGVKIRASRLRGLESRGWHRGQAGTSAGGYSVDTCYKPLPLSKKNVCIRFDPPFQMDLQIFEDAEIVKIYFPTALGDGTEKTDPGRVDAVEFSELCRDLLSLVDEG